MIDEKVQSFVDEFSNPLKSCAQFYGYYYLSEVERVQALDFDLQQATNKLYDDFYNYGIYAITRELYNARNQTVESYGRLRRVAENNNIPTRQRSDKDNSDTAGLFIVANMARSRFDKLLDAYIQDNIEKSTNATLSSRHTGADILSLIRSIESLVEDNVQDRDKKIQRIFDACHIAEREMSAFSHPDDYIQTVQATFQALNWNPPFGGQAWADICTTLRDRGNTTDKIWVDMMWATEHNTSNWVNKVPYEEDINQYIQAVNDRYKGNPPIQMTNNVGTPYVADVLAAILDFKREGDFHKFWPYVTTDSKKLRGYKATLQGAGR